MRETRRQTRVGTVISDKMDKTVVVLTETLFRHPQYKKFVKMRKKFKAHDEKNECRVGDRVSIMETRPISKEKHWRVTKILERDTIAKVDIEEPLEVIMTKHRPAGAAEAAPAEETPRDAGTGETDDTGSDAS